MQKWLNFPSLLELKTQVHPNHGTQGMNEDRSHKVTKSGLCCLACALVFSFFTSVSSQS